MRVALRMVDEMMIRPPSLSMRTHWRKSNGVGDSSRRGTTAVLSEIE